ncbi:MAG: topoisomerase DNA-binding C4 zinc finger domain-containing protein, partial [Coriobacteriia bacterium]|nr:topoisomerase DNA-binding C4 zinc finger domain-containing protein [Coriobacteriia bacterium]
VAESLGRFAPHITSSQMTANLEEEMSSIAAGDTSRNAVVQHSRQLLAETMDVLLPRTEEVGEALADAVTADARVGACPDCGHDLLLKSSAKTRSSFIGCSAWPDCNVTFPVPSGRIEAVDELCTVCGKPQVRLIVFRQRPRVLCIDPHCSTNVEPEIELGACPTCAEQGANGVLKTQKNPRTLKRFIRCTNYETCNTSFPLPQFGELKAAGVICESCGVPKVIVQTNRGPWELCPNPQCPQALARAEAKAAAASGARTRAAAASGAGTRAAAASGTAATTESTTKRATRSTGNNKRTSSNTVSSSTANTKTGVAN